MTILEIQITIMVKKHNRSLLDQISVRVSSRHHRTPLVKHKHDEVDRVCENEKIEVDGSGDDGAEIRCSEIRFTGSWI